MTLRELCTSYLDITAVPRRTFFEYCRNFCDDEREKEKMEEFCTPEGQVRCFVPNWMVLYLRFARRMNYILIVKDRAGRRLKSLVISSQCGYRSSTYSTSSLLSALENSLSPVRQSYVESKKFMPLYD